MRAFLFSTLVLALVGCASVQYSFTGVNAGAAKTVSVAFFENQSSAPPTYSQQFTESLKDAILRQTTLSMVVQNADIELEGEVKDYRQSLQGVGGNDQAEVNRLIIKVNVRFINNLDNEKDYERVFQAYADYDASENLASVETELILLINEQLSQDILTYSLGDW